MISGRPIEEAIIEDVAKRGYHPRTSEHSDFQSHLIIRDILLNCSLIRSRAATGEIVARLRHHQQVGHNDWVIDIAIGTAAGNPILPPPDEQIRMTQPAIIQIAMELKSIWTEHGKARRNRLRDFNAFHTYAHQYNPKAIAAAFLVVNASDYFLSPLNIGNKRDKGEYNRHGGKSKSAHSLVKETIDIFRNIHIRHGAGDSEGLEALGIVVIEHDNFVVHPTPHLFAGLRRPSAVSRVPPGLKVGDPLHYATMIQRICDRYSERFA